MCTKDDAESAVGSQLHFVLESIFIGVDGFGPLLFFEVVCTDIPHYKWL